MHEDDGTKYINYYILFGLLTISFMLILRNINFKTWFATHYLFSYQGGFYTRALIGSIIQTIIPDYSGVLYVIYAIQSFFTFLLTILIVVFCYQYWKIYNNSSTLLIIGVFITSPGTIQYYSRSTGYFDHIGYIILIFVLFILLVSPRFIHWLIIVIVPIILVLIHENQLLMIAPVLVAGTFTARMYDEKNCSDGLKMILYTLLLLCPAILFAIIILSVGRLDYSPELFNEKLMYLKNISNFAVNEFALMIQFRSIEDNFLYTLNSVNLYMIFHAFLALIALIPSGLVAYVLLNKVFYIGKDEYNRSYLKLIKASVIVCCFAPLLLTFIGHDFPRWMASVIMNLFIVSIIIDMQRKHASKQSDNKKTFSYSISNYSLIAIVAFSLSVGPISPTDGPIALTRLLEIFSRFIKIFF